MRGRTKGPISYFGIELPVFEMGFESGPKKKEKQTEREREREVGGVWFVFLNNNFQFLNNILRIFIHFFTHTYFYKCFQTTIFNF